MDIDDCIIVGAGPAGLTAAIYLARYHLSIRMFDCGTSRAGWIPRTRNHAGFPDGINGEAGAALRTAKGALSAAKSEQGSIASRVASLTSAQAAAQKKFDGTWAINIFQWEERDKLTAAIKGYKKDLKVETAALGKADKAVGQAQKAFDAADGAAAKAKAAADKIVGEATGRASKIVDSAEKAAAKLTSDAEKKASGLTSGAASKAKSLEAQADQLSKKAEKLSAQ